MDSSYPEAADNTRKWPYGYHILYIILITMLLIRYDSSFSSLYKLPDRCWFFVMSGSGVFVNVGRVLTAANRTELHRFLDLPCYNQYCEPPGDKLWCVINILVTYFYIILINQIISYHIIITLIF